MRIYCFLAIFVMIVSSCNLVDNKPKLAEKNLRDRIENESKGAIKMVSFKKTDGKEMNYMGNIVYSMDFVATIIYQKECYKHTSYFGGWRYSNFKTYDDRPSGWDSYNVSEVKLYHKDAKVEIIGIAEFEKKESGWVLVNVELKNSKDL